MPGYEIMLSSKPINFFPQSTNLAVTKTEPINNKQSLKSTVKYTIQSSNNNSLRFVTSIKNSSDVGTTAKNLSSTKPETQKKIMKTEGGHIVGTHKFATVFKVQQQAKRLMRNGDV